MLEEAEKVVLRETNMVFEMMTLEVCGHKSVPAQVNGNFASVPGTNCLSHSEMFRTEL